MQIEKIMKQRQTIIVDPLTLNWKNNVIEVVFMDKTFTTNSWDIKRFLMNGAADTIFVWNIVHFEKEVMTDLNSLRLQLCEVFKMHLSMEQKDFLEKLLNIAKECKIDNSCVQIYRTIYENRYNIPDNVHNWREEIKLSSKDVSEFLYEYTNKRFDKNSIITKPNRDFLISNQNLDVEKDQTIIFAALIASI